MAWIWHKSRLLPNLDDCAMKLSTKQHNYLQASYCFVRRTRENCRWAEAYLPAQELRLGQPWQTAWQTLWPGVCSMGEHTVYWRVSQ
jgi:hypothetical protein